ncbi:MAG: tetratricopeptide repeat-containing sensor histidine kinase [Candidatus Cloacimonetes bacterium]|nr:tetratricopeptide repeat-containing sensor histidine kinase [Candidatus Cloacimonadota bacterium]
MLRSSSKLLLLLLVISIALFAGDKWSGRFDDLTSPLAREMVKADLAKYSTQTDSMDNYLNWLEKEIQRVDNSKVHYGILWLYNIFRGLGSSQESRDNTCFKFLEKAYEIAWLNDDKISMMITEFHQGNIYFNRGYYRMAIRKYESSQAFVEKKTGVDFKYKIFHNLAICHKYLKEFDLSLSYFHQAETIRLEENREDELGMLYNNLGSLYNEMNDQESALSCYLKAEKLLAVYGSRLEQAMVANNLGNLYLITQDFPEAKVYFEHSLSLKVIDSPGYVTTLANIGLLYLDENPVKALSLLEEARQICLENSFLPQLKDVYSDFIEHYEYVQDYEKALYYLDLRQAVIDSLYIEEKRSHQEDIQYYYNLESKAQDIELLTFEKSISDNKLKSNKMLYFVGICIFIVSLLGIIVLLQRHNLRKKRIELLQKKNLELEEKRKKKHIVLDMYQKLQQQLQERTNAEIDHIRRKDSMIMIQSRHSAVGEVIGNIAHQWRQPINAIGIIIQDFADAYEFDELNEEYFQKKMKVIDNLIYYMEQTIDDFKNFFNPAKEKLVFNVSEILKRAVEFVSCTFSARNIAYNIEVKDDFFCYGTPNELFQVIINIMNNAKDAYQPRNIAAPMIRLTAEINDGMGCLIFQDNAGGIDPAIIDDIFEPYITTKEASKGTGMGLYIVKHIIELNFNGKVFAENIEDGACFIIKIPVVERN